MRKLFTTAILILATSSACLAQTTEGSFDLSFDFGFPSDSISPNVPFSLTSKITNNGPDAYPGGTITFAYTAQSPTLGNSVPANPYTLKVFVPALPVNGTSSAVIQNFKLKTDPKRFVNGKNIVIVWPTGDYIDRNDDNNTFEGTILGSTGIQMVSISPIPSKNLKVTAYPNPANNFINIEWPTYGYGTAELCDMTGKIVHTIGLNTTPKGQVIVINTQNIPEGVYFVNVKTDNSVYRQRVTINHSR